MKTLLISYPRTSGGELTSYERSNLAAEAYLAGIKSIDPRFCDGLFWRLVLVTHIPSDPIICEYLKDLRALPYYEVIMDACARALSLTSPFIIAELKEVIRVAYASINPNGSGFSKSTVKCAAIAAIFIQADGEGDVDAGGDGSPRSLTLLINEVDRRIRIQRTQEDFDTFDRVRRRCEEELLKENQARRLEDENRDRDLRVEQLDAAIQSFEYSALFLKILMQTLHPDVAGAVKKTIIAIIIACKGGDLSNVGFAIFFFLYAAFINSAMPHGLLHLMSQSSDGIIDNALVKEIEKDDDKSFVDKLTSPYDELLKHLKHNDNALAEDPELYKEAKLVHEISEVTSDLIFVYKAVAAFRKQVPHVSVEALEKFIEVLGNESELLQQLSVLKNNAVLADVFVNAMVVEFSLNNKRRVDAERRSHKREQWF